MTAKARIHSDSYLSNATHCVVVACAVLLLYVMAPVRLIAAELPTIEASPAIAARMHWIQYNMVSGRIVASSGLSVPKMLVQSPGRRTRRHETLSIQINAGICGMEYNSNARDDQLKVMLSGGNHLVIRRTRSEDGYLLRFEQRPDEPLTLELNTKDDQRRWRAAGFWQLYIAEPDVVRSHLIPLIELLHPSWQLAATGAEIEDTLVRTQQAPSRDQPDRERWSRLVAALGSAKFSERQTAQRALYEAGQGVVPYLQSLDPQRLDAEQTARIRAVVQALSVDYEDRVDRVAAWLASDEQVWLAILDRDEVARRRVAAEQLSRLLGGPIDFDPTAAPEVRQRQIERLRARVEPVATTTETTTE